MAHILIATYVMNLSGAATFHRAPPVSTLLHLPEDSLTLLDLVPFDARPALELSVSWLHFILGY